MKKLLVFTLMLVFGVFTSVISAQTLKEIPREDTLVLGWSITSPIGVTNPWTSTGYTHQEGNSLLWEGLSYFGIYKDVEIPWLADSMEYTKKDFTQLTIKVNRMAKWSDGTPVTSADVLFTFEGQMKNNKLPYHAAFNQYVGSMSAPDRLTVVVDFKIPAPRFKFEVLTLKFDTGMPIVPKHVLSTVENVGEFFGGNEMAHSGPYDLVLWDANQKIYDLNTDWWAVKAGKASMPEVKRVIVFNIGGQVGQGMDIVAQRVVKNEFDATLDMRSSVIGNILKRNSKVTTHTGNNPPYGYLDWWPNSLWVNTKLEPYNDQRVRRAISLAINRDLINEMVYEGAKVATIYPFPLYPGLKKFAESSAVKSMEAKYQPGLYDPDQSEALMKEAGFSKNSRGLWERNGKTVSAVIHGFEGIHSDIVPILVEMLKNAGFDGDINFGTDAYQNMADGKPGMYMFGHGASLKNPYAALELYHSRYSAAIGTSAGNNRFSRYSNSEYDKVLDEMAPMGSDDSRFEALAAKALGMYWKEQIDIPIIQWLHRIPYNQTYWTNWPTESNVSLGMNGAFWHHTGMLVISTLKQAN